MKSNLRIKRFFSYYRPYLGLFIADVTCAAIVALIALVIPLCVRTITGDILEGGFPDASQRIFLIGGVMTALIIVRAGCTYFYDAKGHGMGAMMESDMRRELFEHYQKLSFRFHDGNKPGKLMSRLTNDLLSISELYHHVPEDLVIDLIKFIGAFSILLTVNTRLTLIIFLFLPIMILYTLFFNKKLKRAYKDNLERIGDVNAQVEENLSGIRVVSSFANEKLEINKFDHENNRFLRSRKSIYRNESFLYTGMEAMSQLITVAVAVFGGILLVGDTLRLTDLITFLLYVGYLIEPIPKLVNTTRLYQEGIAGFNRFMDIMEIEPDIQDREDAVSLEKVNGEIRFENVGFRYRDDGDYVLKDISLQVAAGEYVALVGSSGVGKTTLCSLIPRFYEALEGRVLIDGVDVRDISLSSLRGNIGIVQQDVYLFAGSVANNIRYGKPGASMEEVMAAAEKAGAHSFIQSLPDGYDTDIGHRGVRLSGGQKQRLSIARVFLKNPPILIFDEATSSLDNESERIIQKALEVLTRNRTTFVIAHRLSTIKGAGRILVLTDNGIEEQGTHAELIASGGVYARYYNMQMR